jgi:hypothetical protein
VLKAIEGTGKTPRIDKTEIYRRIFFEAIDSSDESPWARSLPERRKLILFGVKSFCKPFPYPKELSDISFSEWTEGVFQWLCTIDRIIGSVTPKQFMQIFPVRKCFDGRRMETKDYFSTMREIRKHGIDRPIRERNVFCFLWDYENFHTRSYLAQNMCSLSDCRRLRGEKGILEEWADRGDIGLGDLVTHVLVHEMAHHFGWSDVDIATIDEWWT